MATDIKVYGCLNARTEEGKVAKAEQVYDEQLQRYQSDINNLALQSQAEVGYYECSTATAEAAKTIAATGYSLRAGGNIHIKMTNANTADAVTLNINNTGAKALFYNGEQASSTNSWKAGETVEVYYDGTSYYANNVANGGNFATIAESAAESDLDISDEDGNVLVRFAGGHLQVKNFSSADALESIQAILSNIGFDNVPEFNEEADYAVGDIVRYGKYVYVFTSAHTAGEWDDTEAEKTVIITEHPVDVADSTTEFDLDISDEYGNVLMRLSNGHIETKYFNSATVPSSVISPKQYFPDFDVVSAPNYPDHDSTIVDNTIWAFHGNRYDVAAGFGGAVYDLNLNKLQDINTKFLWQKADGSGTQELEMKSVDFNPYNRVLAVGNGSARTGSMPNDSYIFLFYDCDDWLTAQGEVNFTNCGDHTKLDVSELGVKSYAFWASKNPVSDQIIVNVNFWKDFYLLRLGKGTNRLSHGSYVYIDNQKYNGTWDILNHWTTNLSPDTQAHGGQYYKGHLYIASNDSSRFIIYDFELNKDNSVVANEILCEARMDNSNRIKYQYPDGMCIHQDIIYVQPLIVDGGSSIQNKVVLKIKL